MESNLYISFLKVGFKILNMISGVLLHNNILKILIDLDIYIYILLQRVEQELKENGSLSMVTLMTTPPPLSASSPGVLDSSTSSNGSNSGN